MAQEYRYQLHDARDDARYVFHRASEATRKADELGATQFQYTPRENEFVQIAKFGETWSAYHSERDATGERRTPLEGQSLDDIQAAEDRQAAGDIASRAAASGEQSQADASERARLDAAALRRIEDERIRDAARAQVTAAAAASEAYKAQLERSPGGEMELTGVEHEAQPAEKGRAGQTANTPPPEQTADADTEAKAKEAAAAKQAESDTTPERETEPARGVPMQTITGARMVYNDQPGQAGAEIHHADGQVTSFGGREAIDDYAKEHKLSAQERDTLRSLDTRADEARRDPNEAARFDEQSKAVLAARRAADREAVQAQLDANAIEQARVNEQADRRPAPVKDGGDNEVQSDEMFHTAETDREPLAPQDAMPPDLDKHFLKVGARDYHFSKNPETLAFSDRGNKLETKSNSAFVADTMVKIAQARGWDEIKVTGSESFKREVWLKAASKGMTVKGYEPTDVDRARLEAITKQQALRGRETQNQVGQIQEKLHEKPKTREQLMAESFRKDKPDVAVKKYPELAGAYAGIEAQRRRVHAEHLTADQTKSALDRINRNAANSIEGGKIPQVKVEVREQVEVTETKEVRTNHHQRRDIER